MIFYQTNSQGVILPSEEVLDGVSALKTGMLVVMQPLTNDMLPYVRGGMDELTLSGHVKPSLGQIVLAETDCGLVLHRIVELRGGAVTLMGDSSCFSQEHCRLEDICGTVVVVQDSVTQVCRQPSRARLWRVLLPVRRGLLRIWNVLHPSCLAPLN